MVKISRLVLAPATALMVVATSGCSGSVGGFSDLTSPDVAGIELPTNLPENALEGFEINSARWVGASADADVWLAKGKEHPVCFLSYSTERWFSACGSGGTYALGEETYWIVPDGGAVPTDAAPVSRNVYRSS